MNHTSTSLTEDQATFIHALHGDCDGVTELRAFPSRAQTFSQDLDELAAFVTTHSHENVFIAVATRRDSSSGKLENCQHLKTLFIDVDFKDTSEEEARNRVNASPLPPTIIIVSGNGLHVYWVLKEPIDLQDRKEATVAREYLRRLATYFKADTQAAEPARVLRMPDTLNFKYSPPRKALIEEIHLDRLYQVEQIVNWLPPLPRAEKRNGNDAGAKIEDMIPEGKRNGELYRLSRSLRAKGFTENETLVTIREVNAKRCSPPLDEHEIITIVHNAFQQTDREDFSCANGGHEETDQIIEEFNKIHAVVSGGALI